MGRNTHLPTGVLPVTPCPTRVRRGSEAHLHIAYANGRTVSTTVDRISDFVAESGNPGNETRLTRLLLVYPSAMLRAAVRETYGRIATEQRSAGCCGTTGCCGPGAQSTSEALGYSEEERQGAPEGADLGLGCGNPQAIAELEPGERVLDLGSGAGFDAFLAARQIGETGAVIGVDMTPEMLTKARANIGKTDLGNVEFRLGEIEHLPVADASVDVIMSNCVVNLSTDKPAVFREAFRVLTPGGRLAISDIVALREIPQAVRNDLEAYAGCVSGAALVPAVEAMLAGAGFIDIRVELKRNSASLVEGWSPGAETLVASALIRARKPRDR